MFDDGLLSFEFSDKRILAPHTHIYIELLYMLEGGLTFRLEDEEFTLGPEQFIVVNPNTGHSYRALKKVLFCCVKINYFELCRLLNTPHLIFTTVFSKNVAYNKLRLLLRNLLNSVGAKNETSALSIKGFTYQFLDALVSDFASTDAALLERVKKSEQMRVSEIDYYIQQNYRDLISLEDLAKRFYFSPPYLSKYFKKQMGTNLSQYLSDIRLDHAIKDMEISKKSITRIAMDNGFPNIAAFNRVYKARYGITPSAVAADRAITKESNPLETQEAVQLKQKVEQYFNDQHEAQTAPSDIHHIQAQAALRQEYKKSWARMINIGPAGDLFNADIREHLTMMKKELNFQYVRFWDLYSPVLFLDINKEKKGYNFTTLDRLFDFLIDNGMRPYIELGFKPSLLFRSAKNGGTYMISQQREILFNSPEDYSRFLLAFATHYSNRYGLEEIESWFFEQWADPRQIQDNDYTPYLRMFEAAYSVLKSISPKIPVGGGGLSSEWTFYASLLEAWHGRGIHPDFISIYCYPYTSVWRTNQHHSMLEQTTAIRNAAREAGFDDPRIHITEWNFTVSYRNTLNDSNFKGAYIIKNVLECMSQAELIGYWYASDLLSEYTDTNLILNGSGGLISRNGIRKPAYYAFDFLNQMGKYLIYKDDHCAITTNGHDDYTIVCHNYQAPNFKYFLRPEDSLEIPSHKEYYESTEKKQLHFQVENVQNGRYSQKTYALNDLNGSAQQEWMRMGFAANLNKQDIDYIKRISIPHIYMETLPVSKNTLAIDTILEPQEVQCIHLTLQIEI